jgi:hypothetical protein
LDYQSGQVSRTHMHDGFECPSPIGYGGTKSELAIEQNPYR